MARPRTASTVLELRGAFKKNPSRGRDREDEPVVTTPLGDPPARLTPIEREAWNAIVTTAPQGVLTSADQLGVEVAAYLLAELWDLKREFPSAKHGRLIVLLGLFGMTPADRSKVKVITPPKLGRLASLGLP